MSVGYVATPKLCYQKPSIGPKHYLAVGASGWVETFERRVADKTLGSFIGSLTLQELISNFVDQRSVDQRKATHWHDVTGYLGRVFGIKQDKVPLIAGVAFWAHVVMFEDTKDCS